jgi:hypothetical protein
MASSTVTTNVSTKTCLPKTQHRMIFQYIRKASLLKHVSYCWRRLSIAAATECLPETIPIVKHFGFHSLQQWEKEMEFYNHNLLRGITMGIGNIIPADKFITSSLDAFLLRMHADKLADVLCSFVTFAERVEEKIQADKGAHDWTLNDHMLIHRRHWWALSCRVMNLIKLLYYKAVQMRTKNDDCRSFLPSYPDHPRLWDAARRAALIYGRHAPSIKIRALASAPASDTSETSNVDIIARTLSSGLLSLPPRGKPARA